ncbi:MAG: UDP-2,3-diacylglucosamine diphosphatase [Pseudomonadota bacterium]
MATYFISDLHLNGEPELTGLFTRFLREEAIHADALYILGDLFEAWIGDDAIAPWLQPVLAAIKDLGTAGVPVYIAHGNRDFLLGETFCRHTGCQLLATPCVINLHGRPTLLLHGDELCTDDKEYQQLRLMLRNPQWQAQFLALPLATRIEQAKALREKSKEAVQHKAYEIMDVNAQTVSDYLERYQVDAMIHGHTHRPAVHTVAQGTSTATRYVLGDWHPNGAKLLRCDMQGCQLMHYPA